MPPTPITGHRVVVSACLPLTVMAMALLLAGLITGATAMAGGAQPPEITLLASPAVRGVITDLAATFERDAGARVLARYEVFDVVKRRIDAGEVFDIAILSPALIDTFIAQRLVVEDTRLDVARHGVAVGTTTGARMPDISTPAALSALLRAATSIAYFKDGTAGAHFLSVVDRLGLSQDVASVLHAYDADDMDQAVRSGRTQYVVGGMGTLRAIPGIGDARNLPDTLQQYTTYTAAVSTSSRQMAAARAFLGRLGTPEARIVITKHGLDPVVSNRSPAQPDAPPRLDNPFGVTAPSSTP